MIKFENITNGRWYYMMTERDLLNDFVLVIGRGGDCRSRTVRRGFATQEACEKEIAKLAKVRIRNGYTLVA